MSSPAAIPTSALVTPPAMRNWTPASPCYATWPRRRPDKGGTWEERGGGGFFREPNPRRPPFRPPAPTLPANPPKRHNPETSTFIFRIAECAGHGPYPGYSGHRGDEREPVASASWTAHGLAPRGNVVAARARSTKKRICEGGHARHFLVAHTKDGPMSTIYDVP